MEWSWIFSHSLTFLTLAFSAAKWEVLIGPAQRGLCKVRQGIPMKGKSMVTQIVFNFLADLRVAKHDGSQNAS
jgi:hypothetical protein